MQCQISAQAVVYCRGFVKLGGFCFLPEHVIEGQACIQSEYALLFVLAMASSYFGGKEEAQLWAGFSTVTTLQKYRGNGQAVWRVENLH